MTTQESQLAAARYLANVGAENSGSVPTIGGSASLTAALILRMRPTLAAWQQERRIQRLKRQQAWQEVGA